MWSDDKWTWMTERLGLLLSLFLPIPYSPEGKLAHVCGLCCHMLWWALMNKGGLLSGQTAEKQPERKKRMFTVMTKLRTIT